MLDYEFKYPLTLINRKSLSLPESMQRSMAAEAEAIREAKAKVCILFNYIRIN